MAPTPARTAPLTLPSQPKRRALRIVADPAPASDAPSPLSEAILQYLETR